MASLSNVSLAVSAGSTATTAKVTVTGKMTFDAAEVGKSYRLEIDIVGEDDSADNRPSTDGVADDELYTFTWGSLLVRRPYRDFVVTAAGTQTFTEARNISSDTLDEDSGLAPGPSSPDNGNTTLPGMPRKDELYARVTLSGTPVSARSPMVVVGVGV
jgi:hypothetical protein